MSATARIIEIYPAIRITMKATLFLVFLLASFVVEALRSPYCRHRNSLCKGKSQFCICPRGYECSLKPKGQKQKKNTYCTETVKSGSSEESDNSKKREKLEECQKGGKCVKHGRKTCICAKDYICKWKNNYSSYCTKERPIESNNPNKQCSKRRQVCALNDVKKCTCKKNYKCIKKGRGASFCKKWRTCWGGRPCVWNGNAICECKQPATCSGNYYKKFCENPQRKTTPAPKLNVCHGDGIETLCTDERGIIKCRCPDGSFCGREQNMLRGGPGYCRPAKGGYRT